MKHNIYQKLVKAREHIRESKLKKEGRNDFSKYDYFTPAQVGKLVYEACKQAGLMTTFDLDRNEYGVFGMLRVYSLEDKEVIHFIMATESPEIKATNATQQAGGMMTYTERYLKMSVFEIQDNNLDFDSQDNTKKEPVGINKADVELIEVAYKYCDEKGKNFVDSLAKGLKKYGKLTDKQRDSLAMYKDQEEREKQLDNSINKDD